MDFRLSERSKIQWVLDVIVSNQLPVSIGFTEFDRSATCKLVSVDAVSGYMTISQISSSESELRLTEEHLFSLSSRVNGVRIHLTDLSAVVVRSGDDTGHFKVKIPEQVFYSQRRDVFRAQVNGFMDVSVGVYAANTFPSADVAAMAVGKLANISVEGCAVIVRGSCSSEVEDYKLLTALKLELPDDADFPPLFADIRHCRPDIRHGSTMLGFSFVGMDRTTRKRLGFLVTRIQLLARDVTRLSA